MKLIGTLTSPFVRKVRVAAAEKRVDYVWSQDNPWEPTTGVTEANPLGKVPVLIIEDGSALYDSRVIVEFLDHVSPISRLIPADLRHRIEVRRWEALADGVTEAGILARLETMRPTHERSPAAIERQMAKVRRGLDAMEAQLENRTWCHGHGYSLADIAVGCCAGWLEFRYPQLGLRVGRPNLLKLVTRLNERASFADTVPSE